MPALWSWQLFYKHHALQVKNNTLSCHSDHPSSGFIFTHLGRMSRKSHFSITVFSQKFRACRFFYNISGFNHGDRLCALSAHDGWIFGLWLSAHLFPSKISTSHFHLYLPGGASGAAGRTTSKAGRLNPSLESTTNWVFSKCSSSTAP